MTIFNDEDIHHGAGAFEQAMRAQTGIPGRGRKMSPGIAVGIIAAAIRSGLPADLFEQIIDRHYFESSSLLKRILTMYEGDDWAINLWHRLPSGKYKLCTELCRPGLLHWRYDPSRAGADS